MSLRRPESVVLVMLAVLVGVCPGIDALPDVPPVPRFTADLGVEFQYIPGGTFTMGGNEFMATPRHQVTLSPFYVARDPVPKNIFRQFLMATGRSGNRNELGPDPQGWSFESTEQWESLPGAFYLGCQTESHPVQSQSLEDARALAAWMSEKVGRRISVISEAQLEYIKRAGTALGDERFWWSKQKQKGPASRRSRRSRRGQAPY